MPQIKKRRVRMKNVKNSHYTWASLSMLILLLTATISLAAGNIASITYNTKSQMYEISSAKNLYDLAVYTNGGTYSDGTKNTNPTSLSNDKFDVTGSITFKESDKFIPIGTETNPFKGKFYGNDLAIKNLKYEGSADYAGLFGKVENATIRGVNLVNAVIKGGAYVGGIAGYTKGGSLRSSSVSGTVSGTNQVGGIAGAQEDGFIDTCTVKSTNISATSQNVGGIIGLCRDCSASYNKTISSNVSGSQYVGGIVGKAVNASNNKFKINYSIVNGSAISASAGYSGGLAGYFDDDRENLNGYTAMYNFIYQTNLKKVGTNYGAILGYYKGSIKNVGSHNYYNGISVSGTAKNSGIGFTSGDNTYQEGAMPVFKVSLDKNVKLKSTAQVTDLNNAPYFLSESKVSIKCGATVERGYGLSYSVKKEGTSSEIMITYGTSDTSFVMPLSNVTVDAPITEIEYTIKFDMRWGGYFPSNAQIPYSYTVNSEDIVLPTTPVKLGYKFNAWHTTDNCAKNTTANCQSPAITTIPKGSTGDFTFYPSWNPITYTVVFNANGGVGEMNPQKFTYSAKGPLAKNKFTPGEGQYSFLGWNTKANGKGDSYSDQQVVLKLHDKEDTPFNLYAQWSKDIATTTELSFSYTANNTWTGYVQKPTVKVYNKTTSQFINDEFEFSYSKAINVGDEGTITVTPKSTSKNYGGTRVLTFRIVKITPKVTAPIANELSSNGKAQELVTAGSTNHGVMLYSIDGKNYSQNIPTAVNAGIYYVDYKVEEEEHYAKVSGRITVNIAGTYKRKEFIDINEANGKKYYTLNGNSTDDVSLVIKEDVEVDEVYLNREFTVGEGYSTLVLPFEVETSKLSGIDNILKFVGIGVNEKNVKQVEMSTVWEKGKSNVKLEAHKPYMVKMSSPTLEVSGPVTFKATTTPIEEHNGWTFIGTYKFKEWTETSDELGRAYGFAGQSNDEVSAGQFVKVAAGAYINPMRAYLLAPAPVAKAKSANNVSATASINNYPEKIDMVIVDGEQTTVIGTLYTRTGEIRWNNTKRTFDLKGRHVSKDNTARGAYYKKIEQVR